MNDRVLLLKPQTWHLIKRMAIRSVFLFLLFGVGLFVADAMIYSGFGDRFSLVRRFPDLLPMLVAASKLTFIVMSLFWIRLFVAPKHDVQEAKNVAMGSPAGAAVVAVVDIIYVGMLLAAFLYLMEH